MPGKLTAEQLAEIPESYKGRYVIVSKMQRDMDRLLSHISAVEAERDAAVKALGESEIPADKALEYQQVAAMVCMDIDLLADIAENPAMTAERMRSQIKWLKKMKDGAIADKVERERRFNAGCSIFNLPPGSIRSDVVG